MGSPRRAIMISDFALECIMLQLRVKWGVWNFSTRQKQWRMLFYSH